MQQLKTGCLLFGLFLVVAGEFISNLDVDFNSPTYEDILDMEKQEKYEQLQLWRQKRQVKYFIN